MNESEQQHNMKNNMETEEAENNSLRQHPVQNKPRGKKCNNHIVHKQTLEIQYTVMSTMLF